MQFSPRLRFATCTALTLAGLCVAGSLAAQAGTGVTPSATEIPTLKDMLLQTDVTPTDVPVEPLTSELQPMTAWPEVTQAVPTKIQHNLLAYTGVQTATKELLNADYELWKSHFVKDDAVSMEAVPGLLMLTGCVEASCDLHKSLLVVDPAGKKVFAAMVAEGKVAMWPSLMSWPDEAIPVLKLWLVDATDRK